MLKSITANNLLSWQDLSYEVRTGVSQITGINYDDGGTSEGSGKSSIPDIICWILYGRMPRDVKVDEVVREGCKGGWGEIDLEDGWRVHRSRGPNSVKLMPPEGGVVCGKDAKETQLLINKHVGLDFEAFCQTVYFAQNYQNKFISASETDKARILSEVQDLTIFDRARKKVQEEIKKVDQNIQGLIQETTSIDSEISKLKSNAQLISQFIQKFEDDKNNKLESLKKQTAGLSEKIKHLQSELENSNTESVETDLVQVEDLLKGLVEKRVIHSSALKMAENAEAERATLIKNIESLGSKMQRVEIKAQRCAEQQMQIKQKISKTINKLEDLKKDDSEPGNCPTCGSAASEAVIKKHKTKIAKQVDDFLSEIELFENSIVESEEEYSELQKELKTLKAEQAEVKKKLTEFKKAPSQESAQKGLREVENESQELAIVRRKLQTELTNVSRKAADLDSAKAALKIAKKEVSIVEAAECIKELQKLEWLDSDLLTQTTKLRSVEKQKADVEIKRNNLEILKTGFKEVKQYVFQSLLRELSIKSTALASELFEMPIKIEFNNEDEESGVSKIKTLVTLDGKERSLGLYSGGQHKRIELSVELALAGIVGGRSQRPINMRIFDEPFKDLSEINMQKVLDLFSRLKGNTIIIEHNECVKSIINNEFKVQLRDGISSAA